MFFFFNVTFNLLNKRLLFDRIVKNGGSFHFRVFWGLGSNSVWTSIGWTVGDDGNHLSVMWWQGRPLQPQGPTPQPSADVPPSSTPGSPSISPGSLSKPYITFTHICFTWRNPANLRHLYGVSTSFVPFLWFYDGNFYCRESKILDFSKRFCVALQYQTKNLDREFTSGHISCLTDCKYAVIFWVSGYK